MSNKQLSVGKLKNKTGEEFYPKTVETTISIDSSKCLVIDFTYYSEMICINYIS